MADINKYINRLYKLERTGIKYSLKNINTLMQALGNPHRSLKCIHIAGTNGKGATASFIASILTEYGIKTGLFTSPHILKFNERIRINGKCIPNSYIKNFLRGNEKIIKRIKPSFFEVNTALAFKYFADNRVDAAVIETGLGGRLDSTNVITPLLSVITQIEIDHTEYLGNTLVEIAKEKAGIVKPGVDLIVSDNHKNLRTIFRRTGTFFLDDYLDYEILKADINGSKFRMKLKKHHPGFKNLEGLFQIPLPGEYQVRNAAAAIFSATKFLESININALRKGLEKVKTKSGYRCRFEYVKYTGKNYVLDVSHNPGGIEAMVETAKKVLKEFKNVVVVFAMMKEKDYKTSIDKLLDFADYIIFTKPDYERALAPDSLYKYLIDSRGGRAQINACAHKSIFKTKNVVEGLKKAKEVAGKNDVILITGSFFLVSEVIKELGIEGKFV